MATRIRASFVFRSAKFAAHFCGTDSSLILFQRVQIYGYQNILFSNLRVINICVDWHGILARFVFASCRCECVVENEIVSGGGGM